MLLSPQPLFDCLSQLEHSHIIFTSPTGKPFTQKDAKVLSRQKHITFVCGRYEGIDERVIEHFGDEIFSIGDFVLTGGELPALMMCDAIARHITGVLGNPTATDEESFENGLLEYPSFTKPTHFKGYDSPPTLSQGHHEKIRLLREKMSICKSKYARVDLYLK